MTIDGAIGVLEDLLVKINASVYYDEGRKQIEAIDLLIKEIKRLRKIFDHIKKLKGKDLLKDYYYGYADALKDVNKIIKEGK